MGQLLQVQAETENNDDAYAIAIIFRGSPYIVFIWTSGVQHSSNVHIYIRGVLRGVLRVLKHPPEAQTPNISDYSVTLTN